MVHIILIIIKIEINKEKKAIYLVIFTLIESPNTSIHYNVNSSFLAMTMEYVRSRLNNILISQQQHVISWNEKLSKAVKYDSFVKKYY